MEEQFNIAKQYEKKSFCVLPWIHLATHPIGTVTPCCVTEMKNGASTAAQEDDDRAHLFMTKDSLDSIANSKKFRTIRKEMMEGKTPSVCQKCYKYEQGGVESKRIESNKLFEKYIEQCFPNTNPDGTLKKVNYNYIELRLGTVCNLKCTTCNPFSSNRWHQDIKFYKGTEFEKDYFKNDIKTEWFRDYNFYDELYSKCRDIQEIWINGGEPTLIKEHGYFLQKFIDDGSCKNIDLHYSLNCTQMPDHFIELWKNFRKVRLQLSIDDLRERNYYVRYPSDWDTIMKYYHKILKYRDVFRLEVCQTVSALNVFNIDTFKKWTLDDNMVVSHNYVHYPDHLHVSLIPETMKHHILDNIQYMRDDEVKRLKIELFREHTEKDVQRFHSFIKLNDRGRKLKIHDYLPEFDGVIYDYSCKYPYAHLANNPNGSVKPCCWYSENIKKSNGEDYFIQKDGIEEIFTSDYMKELRTKFEQGKKPIQCNQCWENEELGLESKRQIYNKTFTHPLEKDPKYPLEYQLILNNSCNLRCRMCNPEYSSSWLKEIKGYTPAEKDMNVKKYPAFPYKQPSSLGSLLMEDIEKWSPYVRSLEALGGEPLYSNAWYKLINYLIDNDYAKNIDLAIVTNGTFYSDEVMNKLLTNFNSITMSLSIDGMEDIFEYLRSNAKWNEVRDNIESYKKLLTNKKLQLNFTYTVSWFNVSQISEFIKFVGGLDTKVGVFLNKLNFPQWMSLPAAPPQLKPKILESLESLKLEYISDSKMGFETDGLINFLNLDPPTPEQYTGFGVEIGVYDKYRDIKTVDIVKYIDNKAVDDYLNTFYTS